MSEVVSIAPGLEQAEGDKVQAFVAFLANELREFAAQHGAPGSIAIVIMGDISRAPLPYAVRSWTPGDDQPPKIVVQATASAIMQANVLQKTIEASE